MTHACDDFIYFMAGQLPALTWLFALRDLDLQVVGIHKIIRGNAEARRSYLLDGAATQVSVGIRLKSCLILAAFPCIGFPSNTFHANVHGLIRFLADGAKGHRACSK